MNISMTIEMSAMKFEWERKSVTRTRWLSQLSCKFVCYWCSRSSIQAPRSPKAQKRTWTGTKERPWDWTRSFALILTCEFTFKTSGIFHFLLQSHLFHSFIRPLLLHSFIITLYFRNEFVISYPSCSYEFSVQNNVPLNININIIIIINRYRKLD